MEAPASLAFGRDDGWKYQWGSRCDEDRIGNDGHDRTTSTSP